MTKALRRKQQNRNKQARRQMLDEALDRLSMCYGDGAQHRHTGPHVFVLAAVQELQQLRAKVKDFEELIAELDDEDLPEPITEQSEQTAGI
jgi:hypothetical protein